MKGITAGKLSVLLVCTFAAVLLPGARLYGENWQITSFWGPQMYGPPPSNYYYSDSHVLKQIRVNGYGVDFATPLGGQTSTFGGNFDGEVWANAVANDGLAYSTSFEVKSGYSLLGGGATFQWESGDPSPGARVTWSAAAEGYIYLEGYAFKSGATSTSHAAASAYGGGGGSPSNASGSSAGGQAWANGSQTSGGTPTVSAYCGGTQSGDYYYPTPSTGGSPGTGFWAWVAGSGDPWYLDTGGVYQTSAGTTTVQTSGNGGANADASVSISVPAGGSAYAHTYVHSYADGGYSATLSTP